MGLPIESREGTCQAAPLMERLQKDAQGDRTRINDAPFHASQFLKLREFLAAFPEDKQKEAIKEAEKNGKVPLLRRGFSAERNFYTGLIQWVFKPGNEQLQNAFLDNVQKVMSDEGEQAYNQWGSDASHSQKKNVLIVGAGGSAIAAGKRFLDAGLGPDNLLLVTNDDAIGGPFHTTGVVFDLVTNIPELPSNYVVQPKDIAQGKWQKSADYQRLLTINAYFSGIKVAFGHTVTGVIEDQYNPGIILSGEGKTLQAGAVIVATGTQKEYGRGRPTKEEYPENIRENIFHASEFALYLATLSRLPDIERNERFYDLCEQGIAFIGEKNSRRLVFPYLEKLWNRLDRNQRDKLKDLMRQNPSRYPFYVFDRRPNAMFESPLAPFAHIVGRGDIELDSMQMDPENGRITLHDTRFGGDYSAGTVVFSGYDNYALSAITGRSLLRQGSRNRVIGPGRVTKDAPIWYITSGRSPDVVEDQKRVRSFVEEIITSLEWHT